MEQKIIFYTFLTLFLFILVISIVNTKPDIQGYIMEVQGNRILLAEGIPFKKYEEIKGKTVEDIDKNEENISLIYLIYSGKQKLEKGDNIKVWTKGGIDQSYPAQGYAKKIKVIINE
ncbi:DUF3221 domain-containing protein [Bacillaceae bacterium S4-13-58]